METVFVQNGKITPDGIRLIRWIDQCVRRKGVMSPELRHYVTVVYRARLMGSLQWLSTYPEKAAALWEILLDEDEKRQAESENLMNLPNDKSNFRLS
ncbi:MAG: hypothetical protein MUF87_15015 [Anaerolineae bacterium]|jgi:hypothetical protein|nr:hypothetical protein [Anaerolineae bacterium]